MKQLIECLVFDIQPEISRSILLVASMSMVGLSNVSAREVSETVPVIEEKSKVVMIPRTGGYIEKNKWRFAKVCNLFQRKLFYTAQYDLYDKYSGNDIRTVRQNMTTKEEQWRLVY